MSTKTCTECHTEIPAGEAVIRSHSLERVHFHRDCYELRGIHAATLGERLAAIAS